MGFTALQRERGTPEACGCGQARGLLLTLSHCCLLSPSKEQVSVPEAGSLSPYMNLQINELFEQELEHLSEQLYRKDCVFFFFLGRRFDPSFVHLGP